MNPKIFYVLFFMSIGLFAQEKKEMDTLRISINPATTTRVVLYSAEGAQQKYITYRDATDGNFDLPIPKNLTSGMYRLVYDQKTMDYIDFLYFGKTFELTFDPTKPEKTPVFKDSDENTRYFSKLHEFGKQQQVLDSLQVLYFQERETKAVKKLKKIYSKTYASLQLGLNSFIKEEPSTILKDLIFANVQVKPSQPIRNPEEYLPFVKSHYFDRIDFSNKTLIHSSLLIDRVMDYVFYLTVSNDPDTQNELHKQAVSEVLNSIDNQLARKGFIQALLQSFAKDEIIDVADYIIADYYEKLPASLQNKVYISGIKHELNTAVGRTAPDILWTENDKAKHLLGLDGFENYIVVFWSTTCPHCMKEIPKLYEYTKDNKAVKVIAVSLESEESKGTWKSESYYYPNFSHILAIGKWDHPIPRSYNVHATPTYFVLDAKKRIISKPFELIDLKVFLKGLETDKK